MNASPVLVIGLGNRFRRDDFAGIEAVRRLNENDAPGLKRLELSGEGTSLMDAWEGHDRVILIDAVNSSAPAGTFRRLNVGKDPVPANYFSCSTHNFGVAEAIELSRSLDRLPDQIEVYGIEGKDFNPGEGLSPEVEEAVKRVVEEIQERIRSL